MKQNETTVSGLLKNRSSHRKFLDKEISAETMDLIIEAARRAPTSRHAQAYSIICLEDKELIQEVAKISGQPYIANANKMLIFVNDFYRFSKEEKPNQMNSFSSHLNPFIASNLDIGLAMMASIIQAEELGVGSCCIGVIRYPVEGNDKLEKIKKLLDLPKHTLPCCGLILGYKKSELKPKPRLPKESQVFINKYDHFAYEKVRESFDKTMVDHYNSVGLYDFAVPWSKDITSKWIHDKTEHSWTIKSNQMLLDSIHKQKILLNLK